MDRFLLSKKSATRNRRSGPNWLWSDLVMSRQMIHPLKTQSPHLLPLYTTRRAKQVTCQYRAAALQRSRHTMSYGTHAGHFRSKPRHHKSHWIRSRGFSGSICPCCPLLAAHTLLPFCKNVTSKIRSVVCYANNWSNGSIT
jgi:hypothetical protein